MSGVNKVILVGNLGRDPELRYTSGGKPCCTLSLATSGSWHDKTTGQTREDTQWHRVVVWGAQAEACKEHLAKGRQVYVEGRLQTREWEKDGAKQRTTEVVAGAVVFLGGGGKGERRAPECDGPAQIDGGDDVPF